MTKERKHAVTYIDIVLARGPGPESDFVEIEDSEGRSIRMGEWIDRDDGLVSLRIPIEDGRNWRRAIEDALGLAADPDAHTPDHLAAIVLAQREIGNRT